MGIYVRNLSHISWDCIEGVNYTDDLDEFLNDPEIQLVCICTPHPQHYSLAKTVLEHGKNCLVEKPFTDTIEQAEELFSLAAQKNLIVQCYLYAGSRGLWNRSSGTFRNTHIL